MQPVQGCGLNIQNIDDETQEILENAKTVAHIKSAAEIMRTNLSHQDALSVQ
jgi:biotin-(acetyl-CoA carboxylase) ligase